jgi:hypothetical protein
MLIVSPEGGHCGLFGEEATTVSVTGSTLSVRLGLHVNVTVLPVLADNLPEGTLQSSAAGGSTALADPVSVTVATPSAGISSELAVSFNNIGQVSSQQGNTAAVPLTSSIPFVGNPPSSVTCRTQTNDTLAAAALPASTVKDTEAPVHAIAGSVSGCPVNVIRYVPGTICPIRPDIEWLPAGEESVPAYSLGPTIS